jgi:hypothetical protein
MARARSTGNGRLEEALAALTRALSPLIQSQATLIQIQTSFLGQVSQMDRRTTETNRSNAERFARIEERLARLEAQLQLHHRILQAFLDSIRRQGDAQAPHPDRGAQGPAELPPPFYLVLLRCRWQDALEFPLSLAIMSLEAQAE